MKSKLLKATVLATAAIAIGAFSTPTMAKSLKYIFGTTYGGEYCDGITLSTTNKESYQGFHVNDDCGGSEDAAGGLVAKIGGASYIEGITEVSDELPNTPLTYYLDTKAMTWYLYLNLYNLEGTNVYEELNAGTLIKGEAGAAKKGGTPSFRPKAGAIHDKMPTY
jgi:hypothetical protein